MLITGFKLVSRLPSVILYDFMAWCLGTGRLCLHRLVSPTKVIYTYDVLKMFKGKNAGLFLDTVPTFGPRETIEILAI
jgi:hypothetical protein